MRGKKKMNAVDSMAMLEGELVSTTDMFTTNVVGGSAFTPNSAAHLTTTPPGKHALVHHYTVTYTQQGMPQKRPRLLNPVKERAGAAISSVPASSASSFRFESGGYVARFLTSHMFVPIDALRLDPTPMWLEAGEHVCGLRRCFPFGIYSYLARVITFDC